MDPTIIARARLGDRDALGAIYERYAPQIARFVRARLPDPFLVEDVVSAVFVEVVERITAYEDRGYPISGWLYTIARSRLADAGRRAGRDARRQLAIEEWNGADDGGIALALVRLDFRPMLTAIRLLPARQRHVIELRFLQDVSIADVATQLQVAPSAVKALQHRGLANLARFLDDA